MRKDTKCKGCGQFAGRGHKCPTVPPTTAGHPFRNPTPHTDASSLTGDRVARAREAIALFEVGGCVRDSLIGIDSKDIDFAVEAPSYEAMRDYLDETGFTIFLESPEYLTVRARFPNEITDPAIPTRFVGQKQLPTADFVLARKDGEYLDGRRPDTVEHGTIYDDLARRDFTVNAIARDRNGVIIDPHGGQADLATRTLRAVGDPQDRLSEDSLRALRAVRFMVTKDLNPTPDLWDAMRAEWLPPMLASVSSERRREELLKAFHTDTPRTMDILWSLPRGFRDAVFEDGLWLKPTLER